MHGNGEGFHQESCRGIMYGCGFPAAPDAAAEAADRDSSKERRKEQMDLLHLQKPSGAIQRDRRTNSWK